MAYVKWPFPEKGEMSMFRPAGLSTGRHRRWMQTVQASVLGVGLLIGGCAVAPALASADNSKSPSGDQRDGSTKDAQRRTGGWKIPDSKPLREFSPRGPLDPIQIAQVQVLMQNYKSMVQMWSSLVKQIGDLDRTITSR